MCSAANKMRGFFPFDKLRVRMTILSIAWAGRRSERFDAVKDGLGLDDHAFAAAEGTVVHGAMAVVGEVAQVVGGDVDRRRWRWPGSGFRGRAGRRRSWGRW